MKRYYGLQINFSTSSVFSARNVAIYGTYGAENTLLGGGEDCDVEDAGGGT
jgi:hypothetical protein